MGKWVHSLSGNGWFYTLTILSALGLKYHYSIASSDELLWILRPTARLVEWLTGIPFIFEPGTGYINTESLVIIAKSCAGVNFFIIAFCMVSFTMVPLFKSTKKKAMIFGGSVVVIYLLTIVVNALRIMGAIYLFKTRFGFFGFDKESMHRIEGIFFYFFFLCVLYFLIKKIFNKYRCNHETCK